MGYGAGAATWKTTWSAGVKSPDRPSAAVWRSTADPVGAGAELAALDDRSLVEAFLAGRREAFDVIVERHRRQVYQVCFRFVNNHEDASDLTQDVFVRAF